VLTLKKDKKKIVVAIYPNVYYTIVATATAMI